MPVLGFIGDELTAVGFRLAGVHAESPAPEAFLETYEAMRGDCELLIVTEAYAAMLDPRRRARDEAGASPLLLVIGDIAGDTEMHDVAAEVRRHLGIREETSA